MINTILFTLIIVCLVCWTYFSVRHERKFNEIYSACLAIRDMTDEKALEYAQYVVKTLKENKTILSYSAWNLKS